MSQWLEECRWLFNHFLAERKNAWEQEQNPCPCMNSTLRFLPLKNNVLLLPVSILKFCRMLLFALTLPSKHFSAGSKLAKSGYPRFRGKGRYDSFTFPQSGFSLDGNILRLSKIGNVKVVLHDQLREILKPAPLNVLLPANGTSCFPANGNQPLCRRITKLSVLVGSFVCHPFNWEHIENQGSFARKKSLAKAQRKLSKAKGTLERKKPQSCSRIHERIAWKRQDFIHQHSRRIINRFGIIAVEDITLTVCYTTIVWLKHF